MPCPAQLLFAGLSTFSAVSEKNSARRSADGRTMQAKWPPCCHSYFAYGPESSALRSWVGSMRVSACRSTKGDQKLIQSAGKCISLPNVGRHSSGKAGRNLPLDIAVTSFPLSSRPHVFKTLLALCACPTARRNGGNEGRRYVVHMDHRPGTSATDSLSTDACLLTPTDEGEQNGWTHLSTKFRRSRANDTSTAPPTPYRLCCP